MGSARKNGTEMDPAKTKWDPRGEKWDPPQRSNTPQSDPRERKWIRVQSIPYVSAPHIMPLSPGPRGKKLLSWGCAFWHFACCLHNGRAFTPHHDPHACVCVCVCNGGGGGGGVCVCVCVVVVVGGGFAGEQRGWFCQKTQPENAQRVLALYLLFAQRPSDHNPP